MAAGQVWTQQRRVVKQIKCLFPMLGFYLKFVFLRRGFYGLKKKFENLWVLATKETEAQKEEMACVPTEGTVVEQRLGVRVSRDVWVLVTGPALGVSSGKRPDWVSQQSSVASFVAVSERCLGPRKQQPHLGVRAVLMPGRFQGGRKGLCPRKQLNSTTAQPGGRAQS